MKFKPRFFVNLLAVAALLSPLLVSAPAQAQNRNAAQAAPRIEVFNVDEVNRLVPGTDLNFDIYGTPGGLASLQIEGARRQVILVETEPGQYEGTYTISSSDQIVARSPVTANLRVGNQVTSQFLNESLQTGVGYHSANQAVGLAPRIDRFQVAPMADLRGGSDMRLSLKGSPGGQADVVVQGVRGKIQLPEVSPGEYASVYTIRNRDRIVVNSVVTAHLRLGERLTSAVLNHELLGASIPAQPLVCLDCGTVESINVVEVKGEGGYLGTIGGGVLGAVLGNQVGGGTGRTVAQIAGVLGGAYAGRALEAKSNDRQHFEVRVRLNNGGAQMVSYAAEPGFRVGDKVRVSNGVIERTP